MQFWCPTHPQIHFIKHHLTSSLLVQVSLESNIRKNQGPGNLTLISLGVTASCKCPSGDLIIGCGDLSMLGVIVADPGSSKVNPKAFKPMIMLASTEVQGGIMFVIVNEEGSKTCHMYKGHLRPCSGKVHPTQTSCFLCIAIAHVACTPGMVAAASVTQCDASTMALVLQ
jgi:hypothetical protein